MFVYEIEDIYLGFELWRGEYPNGLFEIEWWKHWNATSRMKASGIRFQRAKNPNCSELTISITLKNREDIAIYSTMNSREKDIEAKDAIVNKEDRGDMESLLMGLRTT